MCAVPRVSEDHLIARRQQILDAARVCFMRDGLHASSMQHLIKEAGLSVGAVYRYFKSKNEIIAAIAEQVAGGLVTRMEQIADTDQPLIDKLEAVMETIDEQTRPGGNFPLGLQVWAESTLDPAVGEIVRARYEGMGATFAGMVEMAVARGELPPDTDRAGLAAVLFGLIPGYALQKTIIGRPDKETFMAGVRGLVAPRHTPGLTVR
jgi:AcrR family transcriptional regulator